MAGSLDRLKAALAGRYEIEREIGAGGMATVYLARDVRHERQVAVKVLRPELAATLGPERFLQEVRIAANLTHPHILPLYDSGEADGFLFYVMPYIEGESLRERLNRSGELPVAEAARIVREVLDALAYAHGQGVVHRDIKPDNVMLSGRHALVTDFGVAKAVSESTGRQQLTTAGVALGTPSYMAPEQAAASPNLDHRVDIYAVGALAYELLTGRPPFVGPNAQAVLAAHMTDAPDAVTTHRKNVPAELEQLVMRCLAKKPADRWQTADEMLPQFETFATSSGGITPTQSTPMRLPRGARRGLAAAGVVAAVAAVGGYIWLGRDAGSPTASTVSETEGRLVIVPFANRTGDPEADLWGRMASDWSTRAVGRTEVEVVPANLVEDAIRTIDVSAGISARRVAELTRADYTVSGSYSRVGDRVRFDLEVSKVATGELIGALDPIEGSVDSIEALVGEVANRVAAAAVTYMVTNASLFGSLPRDLYSLPPSLQAYRAYSAAVDAFCLREYETAIDYGEAALAQAPDYAPVVEMMVAAHNNIGRLNHRRDSLLALGQRLVPRMTDFERLRWQWLTADRRDERFRAGEGIFRHTAGQMWYFLAYRAIQSNELAAAREAVDSASSNTAIIENPCWRNWEPLWTVRAMVNYLSEDHEAELEVASEGRQRFPTYLPHISAQLRALGAMGRFGEMDSIVDVAFDLPPQETPVGSIPTMASFELTRRGFDEAAEVFANRGANWFDEHPEADSLWAARGYYYAGRYQRAADILSKLAAGLQPDGASAVTTLRTYGTTLIMLGRIEEAKEVDRRLAASDRADAAKARAFISAVGGDREGAVAHLQTYFDRQGLYYTNGDAWLRDAPELAALRGFAPFETMIRPR